MYRFGKENRPKARNAHELFPRMLRRYPRLYRQYVAYRIRKAIRRFVEARFTVVRSGESGGDVAKAINARTLPVVWRETPQGVHVLLNLPRGPLRFFLEVHRSELLAVLQQEVGLAIADVIFVHE